MSFSEELILYISGYSHSKCAFNYLKNSKYVKSAIIAMASNSISQHLYSMKNTKLMCHCGMKVVRSIQHFLQSQESCFFCFLMVIHHFVFRINSRLTLNPETIIFINTIIVFVTLTLLNTFNGHYPES